MPTCFVVMGFGKKTDYVQNKTFDLDKSYRVIIKPAVEAAGYTCVRADEIPHSGNINAPMYERLFDAELVIADLSTANLNAFFELGVRYALKPRTTIVIAERGFTLPFDMGQVLIRRYTHLGDGIDYEDAVGACKDLTTACQEIAAANRVDSPVYTFLTRLSPPARQALQEALADSASDAAATGTTGVTVPPESIAGMMAAAMAARANNDFATARAMLTAIKTLQGSTVDPFIVQQLALVTYKSKDLPPRTALLQARAVLETLSPKTSIDPETLGIWGAIHKRLAEIGESEQECREALDESVTAYERGFVVKHDYYNGINYAFLLDLRASKSQGDDAVADRVLARRVRQRVLTACEQLLAAGVRGEDRKSKAETEYWVRATLAEALFGLGRTAEADAALAAAKQMTPSPEPYMIASTEEQLGKLARLLDSQGAPPAVV